MPTIDKRYLLKLMVMVAVGLGALIGLQQWQARWIPDALRRQTERDLAAAKPDAAVRHLRQLLEFTPDDIDAQEQLAGLLKPRNATNELIFLYDRILRGDPARIAVRKDALLLALKTGRFSDALSHAETLLKAGPNAELLQQQAAAQAGLRQFDAAEASYRAAVKVNPNDALAWQRLAQFLVGDARKADAARVVVDDMVKTLPNDVASYLTRVRLAQMNDTTVPLRKADPVLKDIETGLSIAPQNADLMLMHAERLQRHRDIAGARTALAKGVAKYPGDERLVRALAWLEVNRHNAAGAVSVLEDALPHVKDPLDLLVPLADLVLDAGDIAKAEDIVRKLDRKTSLAAKLQAKYLRGRLLMKAQQWGEATDLLTVLRNDAVTLPGLEAQANLLLATCWKKRNEPAKAVESLKLITAKDASNLGALTMLGQLSLDLGKPADAIKAYEQIVMSPFAQPSAMSMLVRLHGLQLMQRSAKPSEWTELEKRIAEFAPRYGTNAAEPAILRSELAIWRGELNAAIALLRADLSRRPQSTVLWCKLADATGKLDGVAAGLSVLDEAMGFVADGSEMRLARAKLYAADPAKLRPLKLLLNGIESWNDADQLSFAEGMVDVFAYAGEPADEAWAMVKARRPDVAMINQFDDMAKRLRACDEPKLNALLTQLDADPRWNGTPMRLAIMKSLHEPEALATEKVQNPSLTLRAREILAAAKPILERQPGGLGWLSDRYAALEMTDVARDLRRTAMNGPNANVEDFLRGCLSTDSKGTDEMKLAERKLSPHNHVVLQAARTGQGFVPEPQRAFVQARLSIAQARMDRTGSIEMLEDHLKQSQLQSIDRAWATRNLAMLLVVRGEVADRDRAAALLTDAALTDAGSSIDDRRTTAATLAGLQRYLDGDTRTKAITHAVALMEKVADESKQPKDAFTLCRFYKAAGRTDDAVAKLQTLLKSDPGNIDYLLAGLDVLVEAKQYDPAAGFAERLLTLAGDDYRVVSAVAKYEAARGDTAKALTLADGYFRTADPYAGDVAVKTQRTADLLGELAKRNPAVFADAAAAKYEALLPGKSEAVIALTGVLASAGRADDALAKLERLGRGLPPRITAMAAVNTLRLGTTNAAKVKPYVDAALKAEPANVAVKLCDAEYRMLTGDHAGAEAIYEAVLKDQPRNVAALNNLAWLLAAKPEKATRALELIDAAAKETGLTGELLDTRSRIRLAKQQPELALADAGEALRHDKTALRYFHLGLAMAATKPDDAAACFKEAKARGLSPRQVHPADMDAWKTLEK